MPASSRSGLSGDALDRGRPPDSQCVRSPVNGGGLCKGQIELRNQELARWQGGRGRLVLQSSRVRFRAHKVISVVLLSLKLRVRPVDEAF